MVVRVSSPLTARRAEGGFQCLASADTTAGRDWRATDGECDCISERWAARLVQRLGQNCHAVETNASIHSTNHTCEAQIDLISFNIETKIPTSKTIVDSSHLGWLGDSEETHHLAHDSLEQVIRVMLNKPLVQHNTKQIIRAENRNTK
jgi:hypothetical protein